MKTTELVVLLLVAAEYGFSESVNKGLYIRLDRMLEEGDEVHTHKGGFEIIRRLGGGVFGSVFEAYWKNVHRSVAIKVENQRRFEQYVENDENIVDFTYLTYEYRIMKEMNNTRGFPLVYSGFLEGTFKSYAMELVGDNLHSILRKAGGKLAKREVGVIGAQLVNRLESLHSRGYLMNDLHLGNLLLGNNGIVYLTDFAWVIRFRVNGRHIPPKLTSLPPRFSRSRRDELFVFLKLLAELNSGKNFEEEVSIRKICHGESAWLQPAFAYIASIDFDQDPNYKLLGRLILA
jgi:serine/threonine protein kinase